MSDALALVLFDVDGTLCDSRSGITEAMGQAFKDVHLPVPQTQKMLSVVGLSLCEQANILIGADQQALKGAWVNAYKASFKHARQARGVRAHSPLFYGVQDMLQELSKRQNLLLGLATGKSKRGLDAFIEGHGLGSYFITLQSADNHPSKPHPSMVLSAIAQSGVCANRTIVVGDTSFDVDMAHAAKASALAVGWGYHDAGQLAHAQGFVTSVQDIPKHIDILLER